ncbi:expressed unknown protein [Ectocarpus siliculosus]|uniref:Uncharacterized protein n=1 Tax=Ectocarpus siliculosus TaxID=2880 RepID=D7FID6_ECTSI|nr:expressed unknown protein [Ectocarpus siliculosus]|eukprot:CBJ28760.1 expressed unknown protein [Ectocarpus siliculosus]
MEEAERRGVVVLITERMSESVDILAHLMQWDMDTIELNVGSQRVQDAGRGYFSCPAADTTASASAPSEGVTWSTRCCTSTTSDNSKP